MLATIPNRCRAGADSVVRAPILTLLDRPCVSKVRMQGLPNVHDSRQAIPLTCRGWASLSDIVSQEFRYPPQVAHSVLSMAQERALQRLISSRDTPQYIVTRATYVLAE